MVYFTSRKQSIRPRLRVTRQPPLRGGRRSPPQSRFSISNFRVLFASLVIFDRPFFSRRAPLFEKRQSTKRYSATTFCGQVFAVKFLRTRHSCKFHLGSLKSISISIIRTEKQIIEIVRLFKLYLFSCANNRNRN